MKLYYVTSSSKLYTEGLRKAGCKYQLRSFYFLKSPDSRTLIDKDYDLIDSGGFSARINGATIDVREYAKFLNQYQIRLAFNLDTNSVKETLYNQKFLDTNCPNTYILPVYHVSDFVDDKYRKLLDYYIAMGYKYIGIGGVAGARNNREQERRFYNYVFARTKGDIRCHGLGITSEKILRAYPWYSCDSSSFLAPARFASMKTASDKMAKVLARTRRYDERVLMDLPYWQKLERSTNLLWKKRGITWEEANSDILIKLRDTIKKEDYDNWKQ